MKVHGANGVTVNGNKMNKESEVELEDDDVIRFASDLAYSLVESDEQRAAKEKAENQATVYATTAGDEWQKLKECKGMVTIIPKGSSKDSVSYAAVRKQITKLNMFPDTKVTFLEINPFGTAVPLMAAQEKDASVKKLGKKQETQIFVFLTPPHTLAPAPVVAAAPAATAHGLKSPEVTPTQAKKVTPAKQSKKEEVGEAIEAPTTSSGSKKRKKKGVKGASGRKQTVSARNVFQKDPGTKEDWAAVKEVLKIAGEKANFIVWSNQAFTALSDTEKKEWQQRADEENSGLAASAKAAVTLTMGMLDDMAAAMPAHSTKEGAREGDEGDEENSEENLGERARKKKKVAPAAASRPGARWGARKGTDAKARALKAVAAPKHDILSEEMDEESMSQEY